jgi:hypothetical protein
MNVLPEPICMICTQFWTDGRQIVPILHRCVCPYPHSTIPTPLPGWKSAIFNEIKAEYVPA